MAKKEEKKGEVIPMAKGKEVEIRNQLIEGLMNTAVLVNLNNSKDLPAHVAFKIAVFTENLSDLMKTYQKVKKDLAEKYCDKDEKGNPIIKGDRYSFKDSEEDFMKEFEQLLECTTPLPGGKLELSLSEIPKGILSANDMMLLRPIVEFKE